MNPISAARYLHLISPQFKPPKDIDPLDLARRPAQAVAPVKRQTGSIRMATLATPAAPATLAQALRQHGAAYLTEHTLNRYPLRGRHEARSTQSVIPGRPVRSLATNRNRPSVDNALRASWRPRNGYRFKTPLQPGVFGAGTTLRAVPVAARVVLPVAVAAGVAGQLLAS